MTADGGARLRTRIDALSRQALEAVEREGLYDAETRTPHPLANVLGSLLLAGTAHRELAVQRRSLTIDIEGQ